MRAIGQFLGVIFMASAMLFAEATLAADNFTRQDVTFMSVGKKLGG